jgi:hypothetical protein
MGSTLKLAHHYEHIRDCVILLRIAFIHSTHPLCSSFLLAGTGTARALSAQDDHDHQVLATKESDQALSQYTLVLVNGYFELQLMVHLASAVSGGYANLNSPS